MNEVMKVPEGWEIKLLEELCKVVGGGTPKRDDDDNWLNGLIPWATPTDITAIKNSNFINKTKEKITEYGLKNSSSKLLPTNSILLTSRATIGARKINTIPMCTNQGFTSLIPKGNNTKFLFYLLSRYERYMNSRAYGTTFPEISRTEVKNVKVLLPSKIDEQQKIAKILSTLDSTIEASQKLIAKEKNIKKGLMHDILTNGIDENGTIRSPKTHKYKESELGLIPEEWEIQNSSMLCHSIADGTHDTPKPSFFGYKLITSKNLKNNKLDTTDAYLISEEDYININQRSRVEQYDILFGMIGTIGNPVIIQNKNIDFAIKNVGLFRFKGNLKLSMWMYFYLSSKIFEQYLDILLSGSSQKFVSLGMLRNLPISIPKLRKEQEQIVNILTAQDKKIQTEEKNLEKLKELKKGLMDDLLSGKVRIKV